MGHSFRTYLAGETLLVCRTCTNHLAVGESVLSKVSLVYDMQHLHAATRFGGD
jgi:hypothetical protein